MELKYDSMNSFEVYFLLFIIKDSYRILRSKTVGSLHFTNDTWFTSTSIQTYPNNPSVGYSDGRSPVLQKFLELRGVLSFVVIHLFAVVQLVNCGYTLGV